MRCQSLVFIGFYYLAKDAKSYTVKRMNKKPKKMPVAVMPAFPMRINKYLAHKNYASRREADALIEQDRVFINGKIAKLGDKVNEKDVVELKVNNQDKNAKRVYLAYFKPYGIVTALPREGEQGIADVLTYNEQKVFPIGRLDKETQGLIILTNDGRITTRMQNPEHFHEKEYSVRVDKHFSPSLLNAIEKEESSEGGHAKAERVSDTEFTVTVTQNSPQIRSVCGKLNFEVTDMTRIRVINIKIGSLREGGYREIKGDELTAFLRELGL